MDQLVTYDFLLVFHMGLSRTAFEIMGNICQIFLPHFYFMPPLLKGYLWYFVTVARAEKN